MQQGNTSNLVFTILRMLSEVSEYHSLPAGDIICPGGPGATENIQDGDIIEAEIESIGTLRNPVKVRRIVTMMGPDSVQCKLEPGFQNTDVRCSFASFVRPMLGNPTLDGTS